MINNENILKYIFQLGKSITLEELKNKINEIDRNIIYETQKKRFKYEIWDKKSIINGISAKDILKSRKYDINNAYLIYIDNVLVYFQDHNPNESGYVKMNKNEINKIAENFIEKKINEIVDNIIVEKIINQILSQ